MSKKNPSPLEHENFTPYEKRMLMTLERVAYAVENIESAMQERLEVKGLDGSECEGAIDGQELQAAFGEP